jgi:type IV secretion system protein VirB10
VLWQDITTPVLYDARGMPHQFRVAVNSPAASERGETGLDGDVNRHLFNPFPGKIGGIIGLSLIRGGIDAGVQYLNRSQQGNGNSTTNLNFNSFQQGGQSAADDLLRSYIQIPDVLTRDEGFACSIFVVRDLDMRGAYTLVQKYRSQ